jgi:hypothetical protein
VDSVFPPCLACVCEDQLYYTILYFALPDYLVYHALVWVFGDKFIRLLKSGAGSGIGIRIL